MTNTKIEKVKTAISKTKGIIADYQAKLRDLEKQKIQLENDEVVALFRREKLNEDEFAALLRSGREAEKHESHDNTNHLQNSPDNSSNKNPPHNPSGDDGRNAYELV